MQPTDRTEFVRVLNGLAAIKGKDLTPEAISLWWSSMSRWSIDEFKAAASHLVTSCQFMPSPYDFEQLRRAGEPTVAEAWETVISGKPLDPGSRTYRAAKLMGGQYAIRCANVDRELPFIQRRFAEAYAELSDVEPVRDSLPQITEQARARIGNLNLKRLA
jgi:hypothetical protein